MIVSFLRLRITYAQIGASQEVFWADLRTSKYRSTLTLEDVIFKMFEAVFKLYPLFEFLPVEHLIREHQQAYYRALAKGDDIGDCTVFVYFILAQIEKSLNQLIEETRGVTLTSKNRLGLARIAFGEKTFFRKDYQNLLKTISTATASRDLLQGVKMGLLKCSGDKRTSAYQFKPVKE